MSKKKTFKNDVPCSVLLPIPLQEAISARAEKEDRSFSAIVRRALRKELNLVEEEQETQKSK